MRMVNSLLNGVFEILLVLPTALFREAGLLLVAALFGVVAVLVFRRLSDQGAIRRAKNRVKGHLLSLSLYPHEIGLMFRTYPRALGSTGRYLSLMIMPTLAMGIPFAFVAVQVEARFGRLPLEPGEAAVVSAIFDPDRDPWPAEAITLEAPPGLAVETPRPVRIPSEGEVAWRIRALEVGDHTLHVVSGGGRYAKRVIVGDGVRTVSVERPGSGVIAQFLHPVEPPIREAGGPRAIRIEYPRARVGLLLWRTHWVVFFLVVSIGVAVVARYPLGVEM